MPFKGTNLEQVSQKILNMEPNYDGKVISSVSEACKDLLRHMLCKDKQARYDIADVLTHPWIRQKTHENY